MVRPQLSHCCACSTGTVLELGVPGPTWLPTEAAREKAPLRTYSTSCPQPRSLCLTGPCCCRPLVALAQRVTAKGDPSLPIQQALPNAQFRPLLVSWVSDLPGERMATTLGMCGGSRGWQSQVENEDELDPAGRTEWATFEQLNTHNSPQATWDRRATQEGCGRESTSETPYRQWRTCTWLYVCGVPLKEGKL